MGDKMKEQELDKMKIDLKNTMKEKSSMKREFEEKIKQLEDVISSKEKEATKLEKDKRHYKRKHEEDKITLKNKEGEIADTTRKIDRLTEDVEVKQAKCAKLTEDLASQKEKNCEISGKYKVQRENYLS